jgi:IGR protein motif
MKSPELVALGLDRPRDRRYLLHWVEKYRNGEFGIGGDLKFVSDGEAVVRVVEVSKPNTESGEGHDPAKALLLRRKRIVVNVASAEDRTSDFLEPVRGLTIKGANTIVGPYVQPMKGGRGDVARIKVVEGLWEHKRGRIIDGGERRRAEVRAKRGAAERKAAREAELGRK